MILKLYFIDRLETELSKSKIEEKLTEITAEDKFWNVNVKGKYLCHIKFDNNYFSFFYLKIGRHDMLSPKIHGKILEGEKGCIIELFYSRTWEFAILLILWTFFSWIDVKLNIINIVCHCLFYILGIWIAKMHCTNICKKVVDILKREL